MEADRLRHLVDLLRRQPEHLAEVAHRALRPVGREGGDQRRVLVAVALVDAGDQHLADVAGEVEVDVGHRGGFVVEEAAGEEVGLHRVDVGEAGEVADDRADAGAAAAPGGRTRAGRVGAAHLDRHLAGELEHVAVEEEEAGEAKAADRRQLLLEPRLGFAAARVAGVALGEHVGADAGELAVGLLVLGAGVAVAELGGEVEGEALGEADGLGDGAGVLGEAGGHRRGRGERRGRVAAPARLGGLERLVQADRDQRVLDVGARAGVRVDVAGGDGRGRRAARRAARASGCAPGRAASRDAAARPGSGRGRRRRGAGGRAARRAPCRRARRPPRAPRPARIPRGRRAPPRAARLPPASSTPVPATRAVLSRVCACAAVRSRHRFRYPAASSTSSVTCASPG